MVTINEIKEGIRFIPLFAKRGGLLPMAVQESKTGRILMLQSMNQEALNRTTEYSLVSFWSTLRNQLWTRLPKDG